MPHFNRPMMRDAVTGEQQMKRFSHSPMTIEHHDCKISIDEEGKITINQPKRTPEGDIETSEVKFSVSLAYKLIDLIELTRKTEWVPVGSIKPKVSEA